jgi:hypothetical protein
MHNHDKKNINLAPNTCRTESCLYYRRVIKWKANSTIEGLLLFNAIFEHNFSTRKHNQVRQKSTTRCIYFLTKKHIIWILIHVLLHTSHSQFKWRKQIKKQMITLDSSRVNPLPALDFKLYLRVALHNGAKRSRSWVWEDLHMFLTSCTWKHQA